MKKTIVLTLSLFLLIVLNGCLTTLHPIFRIKDLVNDNRLTGSWKKTKDGTITTYRKATKEDLSNFPEALSQNAGKIYVATEDSGSGKSAVIYFAFLVKLGDKFYLDTYPADTKEWAAADAFFKAHYTPMHAVYRVIFENNSQFELKQLDAEYLEKLIRNKQIRIKHEETTDGDFLITASTEELQQYLVKYGDVPEAYDDGDAARYSKIINP